MIFTTQWDIIDTVDPGLEITEMNSHPKVRVLSPATSAVKAAIRIGVGFVAFATVSAFAQPYGNASISAVTEIARVPQAHRASYSRGASETDTQKGMSSPKLAERLVAYFVPAEDEEDAGEAYNYGG